MVATKITKFMVDKTQALGTMKVGNGWRYIDAQDRYSPMYTNLPTDDVKLPVKDVLPSFSVVQMAAEEDGKLLLAFEVFFPKDPTDDKKRKRDTEYKVKVLHESHSDFNATVKQQPDWEAHKCGQIEITTGNKHVGAVQILHEDDGVDVPLFQFEVVQAVDHLGAPLATTDKQVRLGGRWVDAQ